MKLPTLPSLPSWFTQKPVTVADHEAKVQAAKSDIAALADAKRVPQAEYDTDPSPATEAALIAADDAQRRAQLRLESAERALAAAKEREATEARQAAEARIAELDALLAHAPVLTESATLEERELQLLQQLVDVRAERLQLADRLGKLGFERWQHQLRLGVPAHEFGHRATLLSHDRIIAALREHLASTERADPRYTALAAVVASLGGDPRPAPLRVAVSS